MEYNTNRLKLIIPEYGRNIHKMIDYAVRIKNRDKRNRYALGIIKLMTDSIHFRLKKNVPYFQHKLWNQLMIMSQYQLDIDTPFPKPTPKKKKFFYKKVVYPTYLINFRYYGKIIRNMIHVAIHCKNEKKKEGLFYAIANTMKKNYMRWNKSIVEDEVIFKDLEKLSEGKICLKNNLINPLLYKFSIFRKKNIKKKKR
ncbi:DUF4290 domain-containing protein [Blattabacterium cuenoti]|uniref:DUF4290 domain-containing protein n=1 Tax=Blattabacterium cuenoti TaxID=1653831 RepID=UPI00163C0436|nr:DUF4290 domain-containing protein [Blattabacterium cuenoti]